MAIDWDDFEDGVARAFWADAYTTAVEDLAQQGDDDAYHELSPEPGGDWMDVLPDIPPVAEQEARMFTKEFKEAVSRRQIRQIEDALDSDDAGFYAGMGALGHGVGLWDYDVDMERLPEWDNMLVYDAALEFIDEELGE